MGGGGYILGGDVWRWVVVSMFWEVVGSGEYILGGGGIILNSCGSWWICFWWWVHFEKWWVVMGLFWVVVGSGRFILGDGGWCWLILECGEWWWVYFGWWWVVMDDLGGGMVYNSTLFLHSFSFFHIL